MARLVLSNGVVIKDVTTIKIAVGGIVKNVTRSVVSHEGIVRQYFPQTGTAINPAILWTPASLTVHQSVVDTADSVAAISFGRSTGFYTHDNYPDAPLSAQFLSPALDGTAGDDGKFLIKAEQISGDALTGLTGGGGYDPGMMTFDGLTGYYSDSSPSFSGNLETAVVRFNIATFTGGGIQRIVHASATTGSRMLVYAGSSDHSNADVRDKIVAVVQNDAGVQICRVVSLTTPIDNQDHIIFFSFDGDNGAATFYIDNLDADDVGNASRVAPTIGNLDATTLTMTFGARITNADFVDGDLGYCGFSNLYLTNPEDFMDGNNPKELDESTWTEWGSQPLYWNEFATMDNNQGSAGNMIVNGTITGPSGGSSGPAFIDLNADLVVSLDQAVVGTLNALAHITISEDDGLGSPVVGTEILKQVTFISEVRAASNIGWSTTQRDLSEFKAGEDADCILTLDADGTSSGSADTSGSFNENWLLPGGDPTDMTVEFTLISGDQPTGSSFDVALPLDQRRQVILLATVGEDFFSIFDVTVADGAESVVKRVTMNSIRIEAVADPVWGDPTWLLDDSTGRQPLGLLIDFSTIFKLDGNADGRVDSQGIGEIQETDQWLPGGELAADYEVKMVITSGFVVMTGPLLENVWYRMTEERTFVMQGTTRTTIFTSNAEAFVRKIGQIATTKIIIMTSYGDNGEQPP